ncbi:HAUS augmin-like complex subunit 7 [Brachyhypopomus gauderio]|uniref:HAUS augmin-like complex subunit 7 n=1 Tax=Brachyhypopomus gauderio TaxID=698409 RepID=UPI004042117F
MAGNSKEQQLSLRLYNSLQSAGCPLVDGLFLREADSMLDLLCKPSQHRMDVLKWMCSRICPSLSEKFSTMKSTQTEEVVKEITRLGHEMMLCKADDHELIKGFATPLQQLLFLEELLIIAKDSNYTSSHDIHREQSGDESMRNEDLLGELMSPDHLPDLIQLMNPVCTPWSAHIREHLRVSQSAQSKGNHGKGNDSNNRSLHHSGLGKLGDDLGEATALLQSTQNALEELRKECDFLQTHAPGSGGALSPCALKVAISDMAQLMTAFNQVYSTEFRDYCQRAPPVLSPHAQVFQSVHQLLHSCNTELEALQQLSDTSSSLMKTMTRIQTDRQYWAKGEKQTLPNQLEALKNKYTAFLSNHSS